MLLSWCCSNHRFYQQTFRYRSLCVQSLVETMWALGPFKDLEIEQEIPLSVSIISTGKQKFIKVLVYSVQRYGRGCSVGHELAAVVVSLFSTFSWLIFPVFVLTGFIRRPLRVQSASLISLHYGLDESPASSKSAVSKLCLTKKQDFNLIVF